ncbi:hypothetical protein NKH49_33405 [Mesorhizobium sp. M1088]|uniref:hypothetical protein n=1 Tax=Mesorhizobium sp. M1088 TaxID=2957056 RepID=UPI00333AE967
MAGFWAACTSKVWLPKKQTRAARFHVILRFSIFRAGIAADSRPRIDFCLAAGYISAIQLVLLRFGTD